MYLLTGWKIKKFSLKICRQKNRAMILPLYESILMGPSTTKIVRIFMIYTLLE